jgi:hypothetical protein
MYLDEQEMRERGVSTAEVARYLSGYRLRDNTSDPRTLAEGSGDFDPGDRLFSLAAPSGVVEDMQCEPR